MSATRWVSLSQLTPYHLLQQSVPVHELKIPRCGSWRAALKASNAALSDGGHDWTVVVSVRINIATIVACNCKNPTVPIVVVLETGNLFQVSGEYLWCYLC